MSGGTPFSPALRSQWCLIRFRTLLEVDQFSKFVRETKFVMDGQEKPFWARRSLAPEARQKRKALTTFFS
eukprot:12931218-Prorocentrum_lima.AAC.1